MYHDNWFAIFDLRKAISINPPENFAVINGVEYKAQNTYIMFLNIEAI